VIQNKAESLGTSGKAAANMQMLESFLGPQGARYAQFVLAAVVLLVLILVVWWLIRKAMGDRLNMSDKPDRRGRPPRLGITESFAVDRQGRRLVMVRRDNVEHLVMIGGPNDVLIESNVIRGERAVVARPEVRISEADLLPQPAVFEPAPPAPLTPKPAPKPVEVSAPMPAPVAPAPVIPAPAPPVPSKPVQASPLPPPPAPAPAPEVELPKADLQKAAPAVEPTELPRPPVQSLSERIRSTVASPSFAAKPAEPVKTPEPVKPAELPRDVPAVVVDRQEQSAPKPGLFDTMKSKMSEALKAPAAAPKVDVVEPVAPKPVAEVVVAPPPPPPPPAPQPVPAPPPAAAASVPMPAPQPAPVAPAPPAAAKPVSRNPFDSLEEEMAKLLGRAPDGKG
jgi:flagellar protein FliO/FliZ